MRANLLSSPNSPRESIAANLSPSRRLSAAMPPPTAAPLLKKARRITGLQRQIYSLYKRSLLMITQKPIVRSSPLPPPVPPLTHPQETRPAWFAFVSHQFRHPSLGGGLRKKDVGAIEYYCRKGEKMLASYESPAVKKIQVPETMHWPEGWVAKGGKEGLGRKV